MVEPEKWGLAPLMTGMAVVIRVADGACPLFRAVTLGHRGKWGQAPSQRRFFAALTSVAARSQSPFSTPRLQFELIPKACP